MARIARVTVPGYPHHITQRGNRRQKTFFKNEDYEAYIRLMAEWLGRLLVAGTIRIVRDGSRAFDCRGAIY